MTRRLLAFFIVLSIALAGYAPSFAMQTAMQTVMETASSVPEAAAADGDCMKAMADDCCDKQGSADKAKCLFDDACAARCHVSAAIAPAFFNPGVRMIPAALVTIAGPPPLHGARAGPLYRPPIV